MEDKTNLQNTESNKTTPEHLKPQNNNYNRPEQNPDSDTESLQYTHETGGLGNEQAGPDGGYGWIIVFCSFVFTFCVEGIGSVYSLLLPEINTALDTAPAISSLGNSLLFGSLFLISMPTSIWITRYGCRPVAFVGACLVSIGFVCSSQASHIWMFVSFFGIIGGIGLGMFYLTSVILVNSYFTQKRGIAQGICNSGAGFGIISFSQLARLLLDGYGWRGTILILSGFVLQLCVCALLMRPLYVKSVAIIKPSNDNNTKNLLLTNKHLKLGVSNRNLQNVQTLHSSTPNMVTYTPSFKSDSVKCQSMHCIKTSTDQSSRRHVVNPLFKKDIFYSGSIYNLTDHKHEHYLITNMTLSENASEPANLKSSTLFDKELLKNKAFLLLVLGAMLTQMAPFIPVVFLGDYAKQIGLDKSHTATLLTVYGIVNTFGRLLAGALTNVPRLSALLICNVGLFICALTLFLFPLCTSFATLCTFVVVHSLFVGFFPPMQPLMTLDCLGLERLTAAFGLITFMKGPAAIFGPPLAGNIYESTKSYPLSNVFAGGLFFAGALTQMLIPWCHRSTYRSGTDEILVTEQEQFIKENNSSFRSLTFDMCARQHKLQGVLQSVHDYNKPKMLK